jgi:Ser/Thr protein kinase RdoA (MazF antagonist)
MMASAASLRLAAATAHRFGITEGNTCISPLGRGLINDSYLVETGSGRWVLQRINGRVFPDPEGIMTNFARLTSHLSRQPEAGLAWPTLRETTDGATWTRDEAGDLWRMMSYLPGRPLERLATPRQAAEVGYLLGRFHRVIANLEPASLRITLPGFHVTPAYLRQFDDALATAALATVEAPAHDTDPPQRDASLEPALEFLVRRRDGLSVLEVARQGGLIPERAVHGDPKLDNLLFDAKGRRALALIDLDTVQPGLVLHDIADCLRSCCNQAGEGARPEETGFDLAICRPLLRAYAAATRGLLSPAEVDLLYPAIRLLPLELGLRFLTDHLQGDRWFRVTSHGQNLAKARAQFALVADIERQETAIRREIATAFSTRRDGRP